QGSDGDLVGGNAESMKTPHQWAQQILKAWLELVDGEHSSIPFDVDPGLTVTSRGRVRRYQPDPDFGVTQAAPQACCPACRRFCERVGAGVDQNQRSLRLRPRVMAGRIRPASSPAPAMLPP